METLNTDIFTLRDDAVVNFRYIHSFEKLKGFDQSIKLSFVNQTITLIIVGSENYKYIYNSLYTYFLSYFETIQNDLNNPIVKRMLETDGDSDLQLNLYKELNENGDIANGIEYSKFLNRIRYWEVTNDMQQKRKKFIQRSYETMETYSYVSRPDSLDVFVDKNLKEVKYGNVYIKWDKEFTNSSEYYLNLGNIVIHSVMIE